MEDEEGAAAVVAVFVVDEDTDEGVFFGMDGICDSYLFLSVFGLSSDFFFM